MKWVIFPSGFTDGLPSSAKIFQFLGGVDKDDDNSHLSQGPTWFHAPCRMLSCGLFYLLISDMEEPYG